jgi:hypothetical protein
MRRCLWAVVLALVTVGATGCIVIDAEKVQSRKPMAVRSDECVVYQGHAVETPAVERDGCDPAGVTER